VYERAVCQNSGHDYKVYELWLGSQRGYGVHDMHMNGALEHLATALGGIEP